MKKYAVVIGNGLFPSEPDKETWRDLQCPKNDIEGLRALLVNPERGNFSPENVNVLLDKTRDEIMAAIEEVFHKATKDDLILIYYSGHGVQAGDSPAKLFLSAHNTVFKRPVSTAVSIAQLREIMDIKVSHKKIILILDCCYSGDAGRDFAARKGSMDGEVAQQLAEQAKGIYLLAAAGSTVAWEREHYSLFTQYLIEGIETGNADSNGDGDIDIHELFDYIRPRVEKEHPKQQPRLYGIGETGGKLVLSKSGSDSRKDRAEKIRQLLLKFEEQHEDIAEIKTEALVIAKTAIAKLSPVQLKKDQLLSDLLNKKISFFLFVMTWAKLATEPTDEKAEQEKIKQAQLARDKEAQDKAEKEKAKQEKIKQAQLARDKEAQDKAEKEKAEQEKIKQAQLARDKEAQDKAAREQADKQDQYGRYLDITVNNVIQRFRWIEAGTFLMGSPAYESERSGNEQQHSVTLTQGYWLADTACTQALWLAVMGGDNPATFDNNLDNPIETVCWYDIQEFLNKLNQIIPNINARLPTEAEWEYACRAGTATPFSFGDNITPEQVNYYSNYPYNGGKQEQYRGRTMPVKSLPPNTWGLYEMHGNVLEWCHDLSSDYPNYPVINPTGANHGTRRVLRGGSWVNTAGCARSAYRFYQFKPIVRVHDFGFRFALGQTAR